MTSKQYDQHHRALDERIIGYSASHASNRSCVTFDRAIVIAESDAALRQWLANNGISESVEIYPDVYAGIIGSLHEEGIEFFFDCGSLKQFHGAMADDLRFVPATEEWTSEIGTVVEPVFNMYRDSVKVLKDQLGDATVGFYADGASSVQTIPLFGTKKEFRIHHSDAQSVPARLTWSEYLTQKEWGFRFKPDVISKRLLKQMADSEQFCADAMKIEQR